MMYMPDASADRDFYQQYVQPGTGNINTGLQEMLAQAGMNAYMNPGQTAWNAVTGAVTGIGNALLHPVDTFNSAGKDLGTSAVYAFNPDLVNNQFQAVYGQDVSTAAATLAALNTSLTFLGVTGAGKVATAVIEGVAKSATVDALIAGLKAGARGDGLVNPALLNELAANGVKFTPENVIATARSPSGQVVFLETGSPTAGLQHIVQEHGPEFASIGVSEAQIPSVVMRAVTEGKIVGYQGSGTGRPIYELTINGETQRIAITTGNNGFIVGANPRGTGK